MSTVITITTVTIVTTVTSSTTVSNVSTVSSVTTVIDWVIWHNELDQILAKIQIHPTVKLCFAYEENLQLVFEKRRIS